MKLALIEFYDKIQFLKLEYQQIIRVYFVTVI